MKNDYKQNRRIFKKVKTTDLFDILCVYLLFNNMLCINEKEVK